MSKIDTSDVAATLGAGKKNSKFRKYIIISAVIALILLLIIVRGAGGKKQAPHFTTEDVVKGSIVVQVSATGTLAPINEVEVGSELSGTIKTVYADYNSRVKKGQLLARIDTEKMESEVQQYKAALEAAKANVLQSQAAENDAKLKLAQYKKLWELTDKKSPSQQDMDTAEATYQKAVAATASSRASVTQAQANLNAMLTDISKADIRSPVNGVVLSRAIEAGQTVAASYSTPTLFTIAEDLKKMEVDADVDEADIGEVKEGQEATFTVAAYPDKVFKGVITQARYGSTTTDNVVTYKCVIQVDNSDLMLRPGMTATADIVVKRADNVIKIPSVALRYAPTVNDDDKRSFLSKLMPRPPRMGKKQQAATSSDPSLLTVWKKNPQGFPEPVQIKVGDSDGTYKVLLKGDLKPGDKLITSELGASDTSGK